VEDKPVWCPFPLVLEQGIFEQLSQTAEALARETLAAEQELVARTDLHETLGLPQELRRCLRQVPSLAATVRGVRVMRFDFHWTTEGWRISEANTDVVGGFIEASGVTQLMASRGPGRYVGPDHP
jgi:glutathionylspermidine synthase